MLLGSEGMLFKEDMELCSRVGEYKLVVFVAKRSIVSDEMRL